MRETLSRATIFPPKATLTAVNPARAVVQSRSQSPSTKLANLLRCAAGL
jgi:hypothetical protein